MAPTWRSTCTEGRRVQLLTYWAALRVIRELRAAPSSTRIWTGTSHSRWDFAKKLNIMASFYTVELECNFIATAPSTAGDKQCLKVISVENASLWDLYNLFRDLIWDRDLDVPVGSCILIGSASHLGKVGPAVYAEELAHP